MKTKGIFRILKSLMGVGLLVVMLVSCSESDTVMDEMMDNDVPQMGGDAVSAPSFSLKDLGGNEVMLADFDKKVLVMFFFGNGCPACKAAGPSIQSKLADAFVSNANFSIVGLDQWDGNEAAVQSFKNTSGVKFPLLLKASATARSYGTTFDRIVVIDKEGNIRFNGTRSAASDVDAAVAVVKEYLDK
ncbi:peroxiredoxin family protein [Carboxylicivirga sp. N1Y90]|uniref:peroxiredoxin family protein n=1 Tax=Carboxylicivirga fragile TaxID=3417571 RepID=UPI003D353B48|nr:TlpA family protein disulfide reductase [Marinilabiliaceae bacterium N1Y90]